MKILKIALTSALLLIGIILSTTSAARAQSDEATPCDSASHSALFQLPLGKYNTYAQAGRAEDKGNIKVYYQKFNSTDCVLIGQGYITESTWIKVGGLKQDEEVNSGSLFIVGGQETEDTQAGASPPQVIFSEISSQPCDPTIDCKVTYQGQQFELSPRKISMTFDSIRVGLLDTYTIEVKEVLYNVDSKVAYSRPTLEEFNENYVPDGEHTISRVIVLSDGQTLSDSKVIKRGLDGGFTYFFVSVLYKQSALIKFFLVVIALIALLSFVLWIVRKIKRKKQWQHDHFATIEQVDMSKAGFQQNFSNQESDKDLLLRYKKIIIIFFMFAGGLVFVNSFVLSYFTVDGVSMFPTLKDRSERPLLILPASIGRLNRNYYTPPRGTIVVVQKDDNNLFVPEAEKEKSYVVKRVIGLPGERVVIKDGVITIFNKSYPKGFVPDDEFKWVEDLTGTEGMAFDITLKEGELFVVGDNRDESVDSRFYGPIKTSAVVGKVL